MDYGKILHEPAKAWMWPPTKGQRESFLEGSEVKLCDFLIEIFALVKKFGSNQAEGLRGSRVSFSMSDYDCIDSRMSVHIFLSIL